MSPFLLFFLQIVDTTTTAAVSLPSQKITFFEMLLKGGWIMIPLIILSIIAIAIMLKSMLSNNNVRGAQDFAQSNNTAIGKVIAEGLGYIGYPYSEIEAYMSDTANIELSKMEKRLNILSIIAGIAPMLGFVGTISGIV